MASEEKHLRQFGKFRLDAQKKVLWHEDQPVNLPLKQVEVLCVLMENVGELVTKEELLNRVWANAFVEESNLSRHIYLLRKTFKDFGESEELIQTVPRRGYRFAGEVTEPQPGELVIEKHSFSRTLIEEVEGPKESSVKGILPGITKTNRLWIPILSGAVIILTVAGFYFYNRKQNEPTSNQRIKSVAVLPVKNLTGNHH